MLIVILILINQITYQGTVALTVTATGCDRNGLRNLSSLDR
jgi:hypothetical protein